MKVGLIGCGGIADLHLKVYRRMKDVDVVGVCDLNVNRATRVAQEFHVPQVFTDYHDLCDLPDLTLIDVCTPVSTHAKIVCDAAKVVPAVVVEKPMALSVAECDQMIQTVKKHGSKLCIIHQQLFLSSIQKAKSLVDRGVYDPISFRTTQKESFAILKANGLAADWMVTPHQRGILWEVCSHLVYLQLHFLPTIHEVYAIGSKIKYPVYDHFAVLLRGKEQQLGLIDLSWVTGGTEIVYELCDRQGQRALIHRDFDYFIERMEAPPQTVRGVLHSLYADQAHTVKKWVNFGLNYIYKRKQLAHLRLLSQYVANIAQDRAPPVTPEEGRRTVHLLECIKRSLDEKHPVPVTA